MPIEMESPLQNEYYEVFRKHGARRYAYPNIQSTIRKRFILKEHNKTYLDQSVKIYDKTINY